MAANHLGKVMDPSRGPGFDSSVFRHLTTFRHVTNGDLAGTAGVGKRGFKSRQTHDFAALDATGITTQTSRMRELLDFSIRG